MDESGVGVCRGAACFPPRRPREWHQTEGFREEALGLEASQRSYRDKAAPLHRYRRQPHGGTPVTTLQDKAPQEGTRVLNFLEWHSQSLRQTHGFAAQGQPSAARGAQVAAGAYQSLSAEQVEPGLTAVCQEREARGFSPAQIATVRSQSATAIHEDPASCTNVAIADINVKQQKAHRERPSAPATEPVAYKTPPPARPSAAGKRPPVAHTVARLERGQQRFTLRGTSVRQGLRFGLAFLLHNELLSGRVPCFTDGYKSLPPTMVAFFAWHPGGWLRLDGYPLVKQCKEDLSWACRGRPVRNQPLRLLVRYWWYGWVTEAQPYLATIPTTALKDAAPMERLRQYLDRHEGSIPC